MALGSNPFPKLNYCPYFLTSSYKYSWKFFIYMRSRSVMTWLKKGEIGSPHQFDRPLLRPTT